MAVTRAQKLRMGVFVALGLFAFASGMLILAGMKLGETRDTYTVRFTEGNVSLSGLEVGSPVKYSGLRIGRVDAVRVATNDVGVIEVVLSLDGGTPVAEDSKANLGSMGITGLKYIELTRGSKEARLRKPGDVIPEGASLIDDLTDQAGEIARKVQTTLDNVNALTGPDMKDRVARLLDRSERTLAEVEGLLVENRDSFKLLSTRLAETANEVTAIASGLNGTVARANRILDSVEPRVVRTLDHAAGLMGEFRTSRVKVDRTLDAASVALERVGVAIGSEGAGGLVKSAQIILDRAHLLMNQGRENLVEGLALLRETAENMAVFSEKIREDPSLLLLGGGGGDEEF
jgi:phospholipid/cholesterol/gamma-HCH transport system substrate-binding protein